MNQKNSQLLTQNVSNSHNIIYKENSMILYNNRTNLFLGPAELRELLIHYQSIMEIRGRRMVYLYFLENIATTGSLIAAETKLSEQRTYCQLKWLCQNKFIEAHAKVRSLKKGGPRPVLYALPDASKEQIARAILRVRKSRTQSYKLVLMVTQLMFEDIQDMQTQFSKIIYLSKRHCKGFHFLGIADLVARELHEKGVKVWR